MTKEKAITETITETVIELLKKSETSLPEDVENALRKAYRNEKKGIAKIQLETILENVKFARGKGLPICQDTGLPVFYVGLGTSFAGRAVIDLGTIDRAIAEGVRRATKEVPLRPNAVHPLTRKNSGDNTGKGIPIIEYEILNDKDYIEITVLPKGAGSENMSALAMLNPSVGIRGVKKFVLETVESAGGNPCPPTILGLGIGGTADYAMRLSKKALLRDVRKRNEDKGIAKLEEDILKDVNKLGIGPMGLGGMTTSLAVNIEYAFCHTASLPAALSIQCWASRRASARIYPG